jgi:hypothetical protein
MAKNGLLPYYNIILIITSVVFGTPPLYTNVMFSRDASRDSAA